MALTRFELLALNSHPPLLVRNPLLVALTAILLPAVVLGGRPAGRAVEEVRSSIERIKREADENRRLLRRTLARERSVVAQLDSLDREVGLARSYLKSLDGEADRLTEEMKDADVALDSLTDRLFSRQAGFGDRLRDIYKRGRRRQVIRVLLTADSFTDFMRRSRYLAAVARQDREDYEAILRDRDAVAGTRRQLEAQQEAFGSVRAEREAQVEALKAQGRTRRRLLAGLRKNVKAYQAAEAQFNRERERSEEALRNLIAEREKERVRKGEVSVRAEFPAQRGRLRWPVQGEVVGRFGRVQDPKLKTWTFNRGIEIEVPEGTRVQTVAAGEVEAVEWFRGYGLFALVGHGDGYYTLYAHLSEVSVNVRDSVRAGEVIARSGNSGTLDQRTTLHFELLAGSDPEDPLDWLGR